MDIEQTPSLGETVKAATYVREAQLLAMLPFSHATLWRKVKAGTFPKPLKFGPKLNAWDLDDVNRWLEACKEAAAGPGNRTLA